MRKLRHALRIALILALICGALATAQSPSSEWIDGIEIANLVPFEISFRLANRGTAPLNVASSRAILSDQLGQIIEAYPIDPFTVPPGQGQVVAVSSRWSFQKPGIYLLEVALDLGAYGLISDSLAFRILPLRLPLAPLSGVGGEGLVTIYQQPVSWGLVRVAAPEAWSVSHGDSRVVVAVIDSGIDHSIPQLAASMWINDGEIEGNGIDDDRNGYVDDIHGWDFRDDDNSSLVGTTIHGHGTFVASIIAAQPGELPIAGIAPGVRIMDVRFLDSSNSFDSKDWQAFGRAIDYAVDNGADIINLSIYANGRPPNSFESTLTRARQRGVIIVGITGNLGEAQVMYPGRYDSVLAVSATTPNDLLAGFSNRGASVAFCAPGGGVTSLTKGGRASTQSGTSFAAPHVSGILALILSVAPGLSPEEAIRVLAQTASDLGPRGPDDQYGAGLVNALAALLEIRH